MKVSAVVRSIYFFKFLDLALFAFLFDIRVKTTKKEMETLLKSESGETRSRIFSVCEILKCTKRNITIVFCSFMEISLL